MQESIRSILSFRSDRAASAMVGILVFFIVGLQIAQGFNLTTEESEDITEIESGISSLPDTSTPTIITTTAEPATIPTTTSTVWSTSKEPTPKEPEKTTYSTLLPIEPEPENTFVVRDGPNICLLAKFHATFLISYTSHRGNRTPVVVKLPQHVTQKGHCGSESQDRTLILSWAEFSFSLYFSKLPYRDKEEEYWGIKTMQFSYDTQLKIFIDAVNAGKKTVKTIDKKEGLWLETELDKSYRCPAIEIIFLYNKKNEKKVAVNLTDVQIQAYKVVDGNFSPAHLCEEASVGSQQVETFRDETAPIAVGSTFAILTLLAVIGFAVYRSVTAKRVDYSTME